jgi:arabinogalactan oligomer/maltooligosaccharide transport system substrate-binding protein
MRKLFLLVVAFMLLAAPVAAVTAAPSKAELPKVDLVMWHQEGEDVMKSLGIQKIFDDWAATNAPGSTLTLVQKETEALRTEFQAAALAGSGGPDLIWAPGDQVGPYTTAGLIQVTDEMVDHKLFIPAVDSVTVVDGKNYGVPLTAGNHLMLFYNKKLVEKAPESFADLVTVSKELQTKNASVDKFTPFAMNQTESFWVFPVAHGFGATEFAEDAKTPTLDTEAWVKTYQLFYDLKYTDKVVPAECDYDCADGGFKNGTAAMIINGDWALGGDKGYVATLGKDLGIATWPKVEVGADSKLTGIPAPFIAGKYLMVPNTTKGDKLTTASGFVKFLTTDDPAVLGWTVPAGRIPALLSALKDDKVANDAVLAETSKVLVTGVPQPSQPEMRCVFDAVTTAIRAINSDTVKPADAATEAQKTAVDCIAKLK